MAKKRLTKSEQPEDGLSKNVAGESIKPVPYPNREEDEQRGSGINPDIQAYGGDQG